MLCRLPSPNVVEMDTDQWAVISTGTAKLENSQPLALRANITWPETNALCLPNAARAQSMRYSGEMERSKRLNP